MFCSTKGVQDYYEAYDERDLLWTRRLDHVLKKKPGRRAPGSVGAHARPARRAQGSAGALRAPGAAGIPPRPPGPGGRPVEAHTGAGGPTHAACSRTVTRGAGF